MTPAIQKGSVSLGLALGGSGFRRKPLFEHEDSDDERESAKDGEWSTILTSTSKAKKKASKNRSTTLQDLTRSEYDANVLRDEGDSDQGRDGSEHSNEVEGEEEDDTNSETPLHPHEHIRGLE
jgi:hypothetical protein